MNERNLAGLAATVLQPGFVGTAPPDWVRRWLADGLGAVVLFARNVVDPEQVAALTATLRAERPDVLVAIDEEAGDVTRIESGLGSSVPATSLSARSTTPRSPRRSPVTSAANSPPSVSPSTTPRTPTSTSTRPTR